MQLVWYTTAAARSFAAASGLVAAARAGREGADGVTVAGGGVRGKRARASADGGASRASADAEDDGVGGDRGKVGDEGVAGAVGDVDEAAVGAG
jgi:hypothetical protein